MRRCWPALLWWRPSRIKSSRRQILRPTLCMPDSQKSQSFHLAFPMYISPNIARACMRRRPSFWMIWLSGIQTWLFLGLWMASIFRAVLEISTALLCIRWRNVSHRYSAKCPSSHRSMVDAVTSRSFVWILPAWFVAKYFTWSNSPACRRCPQSDVQRLCAILWIWVWT